LRLSQTIHLVSRRSLGLEVFTLKPGLDKRPCAKQI